MNIEYPKHYDNEQNRYLDIHRLSFSIDPKLAVTKGIIAGYLPLSDKDSLSFSTPAAETQKVITLSSGTNGNKWQI